MTDDLLQAAEEEDTLFSPWLVCLASFLGTSVLAAVYGFLQFHIHANSLAAFLFAVAMVGLLVSVALLTANREGPQNMLVIGLWGAFSGLVFTYVQWMTHLYFAGDGSLVWTPGGLWAAIQDEASRADMAGWATRSTSTNEAPPEGLRWFTWSLEAATAVLWPSLGSVLVREETDLDEAGEDDVPLGSVLGREETGLGEAAEDQAPVLGPKPPFVTAQRTSQGLLIRTWVPWFIVLIRVLFVLCVVGSLCLLAVGRFEVEWLEPLMPVVGWSLPLIMVTSALYLLVLYFSKQQYVRRERVLWKPDQLEFCRRGVVWQLSPDQLVSISELSLGKKSSLFTRGSSPSWDEYAVSVQAGHETQEWFRSSNPELVRWILAVLCAELDGKPIPLGTGAGGALDESAGGSER